MKFSDAVIKHPSVDGSEVRCGTLVKYSGHVCVMTFGKRLVSLQNPALTWTDFTGSVELLPKGYKCTLEQE